MHKKAKGEYGYIAWQRKKTLFVTLLFFAAAFGIYFGALFLLGTNQNVFTIAAVLVMLPGARSLVNTIMFFRAKPCSQSVHAKVEEHVGRLPGAYELYLTGDKNFALSHLVVAGKSVLAITEDLACDTAAGEQHIKKMMISNGFHGYTIKIFTQLPQYLTRLDQLNSYADEEPAKGEKVLSLLHAIAL